MKVGDTFPVTVAGHVVAQARVAELTREKATLVVPGTVVVMAVNTSLAGKAPSDSTTETIVTGVDRQTTEDNTTVVESGAPLGDTSPQGDTAPVETADTTTTTTVETAPVEAQATETTAAEPAVTEADNGTSE